MQTGITTALRFSAVVSRDTDAVQAGRDLGQATRRALGEGPADLAFLFFSPHYAEQSTDLTAAVRRELAPNLLVGCTGEGIIGGTEEIESAPAISLWAARLPGGWPDELGSGPAPPTFLLLGDPFSTGVDEALSLIASRCPGSMAIGGMAGGGRDVGENRMVLNGEVYEGGLVGVALSGPLSIRTVVSQGCRPIGERYVVTRAENNVIHELGGVPALERLQTVFETLSGAERRLAHRALHIGVVMNEQRNRFERGDFLVRNLIGADRNSGSVAIGDRIQEGQTVQFHIRDAQSASEDLHLMLAADRSRHQHPPLGALLFSCCGRGRGLFGHPHHDVTVLHERAGNIPVAGFFAQGEIGPVGGMNFLHGYTASVALFCEPGS